MTNVRITGPDDATLPPALGGDRMDAVRIKSQIRRRRRNGQWRLSRFTRTGFPLAQVRRMVNAGCTIEGFEVWFELASAAVLAQAHPLAPTEDPEGNPITPETWAEYGVVGNSHAPVGPIDGKYYRSSCMGSSGEQLEASNWTPWINNPPAGVTVITVEAFQLISDINQVT